MTTLKTMGHQEELSELARLEADAILEDAGTANVLLRLLGSQAISVHCQKFGYLFRELGRPFYDVDFAVCSDDEQWLDTLLKSRGYEVDRGILFASEGRRRIYTLGKNRHSLVVDVFVDELDFCHRIDLRHRLEVSFPTISLADLWLSKMQIHTIASRDLLDLSVLTLEHEVGLTESPEVIDASYIKGIVARDWGFCHTVQKNIAVLTEFLTSARWVQTGWKELIGERTLRIRRLIEEEPKTWRWNLRSLFGERVQWYKDVSDRDPVF